MTPVETIQSLTPLAETLNAESNDLNATITALSEKLAGLNLGIELWFDSSEDSEREIGFGRVSEGEKSSWQLATKLKKGYPVQTVPKPLVSASRDVRIEGLERVPSIVANLKREAENKVRIMKEAKKMVAEL